MARSYQNHNPRVSTGYRHDRYKFPSSQVWDLCFTDNLKRKESTALKPSSGKFDQEVHLSQAGKGRLTWWINNIQSASNDVSCSDPDVVISSAASIEGWGCECQGVSSGGLWLPVEAAFFALKAFRAVLRNDMCASSWITSRRCHVKIIWSHLIQIPAMILLSVYGQGILIIILLSVQPTYQDLKVW